MALIRRLRNRTQTQWWSSGITCRNMNWACATFGCA